MKRCVNEIGALAGSENSGYFFFNNAGRGYDDGLDLGACDLRHARSQSGKEHGRSVSRAAQDLVFTDHGAVLRRRQIGIVYDVVTHFEAPQETARQL